MSENGSKKSLESPVITPRLDFDREALRRLCAEWRIVRFELFGSVLRDDFRRDSDVDCMVTFADDARWDLLDLVELQDQLTALFGRVADVVTRPGVERSRNPVSRTSILKGARDVFAA